MIIFGQSFVGLIEAIIYGTMISILCLFLIFMFKSYESEYMPVIQDAKITFTSLKTDDNLTYVNIKFNKIRDCVPVSKDYSWYLVTPEGAERVFLKLPDDMLIPKPVGKNISKNWLVDFTANPEYKDMSHKIVFYHNCFYFWKSRTVIEIPKATLETSNG